MAEAQFQVPEFREYRVIPKLREGAMAHSQPFVAKPGFQKPLGFPGELVDDWERKAVEKMGELNEKYRSLRVFLDSCVKCGACTDKCHYYLGTTDPNNMPVARQDLYRKVYRRYYTFAGKYFPWLVGAKDMSKRSARSVVHLFPPVFAMPPLLGLLPVRNRHRRNLDGGARGHGPRRPGAEVLQRDHRQGAHHRQQPGAAGTGAARHPRGARGRSPRGHRRGGAFSARRERRRGAAGDAVGGLLRRTARGRADRLRQGAAPGRRLVDSQLLRKRSRQLRPLHRQLREHAQVGAAHTQSGARARRQAHRLRRVRPRLARRLQFSEHAGRAVRFSRSRLSGAATRLRGDPRPDPTRAAASRPVAKRRQGRNLSRLVQRRARIAHGRRGGRPVHDPARHTARVLQPFLRHAGGDHRRGHLLLRRRRRSADRRPARVARQGRAAADGGLEGGRRRLRRDPHGRDLRDLQKPVFQGPALLRVHDGPDRKPASTGRRRARAEKEAGAEAEEKAAYNAAHDAAITGATTTPNNDRSNRCQQPSKPR